MLPASLLVLDIAVLGATGVLALIGREQLEVFDSSSGVRRHLPLVGAQIIAAWIGIIALLGGYRRDLLGAGPDEFKRVFNASMITASATGVTCYLAKYDLSRGFFLLAFIIGPVLLLCGRLLARQSLKRARRRGHLQRRVLLAGTVDRVDELSGVLSRENWLGYSVVGAVTDIQPSDGETPGGVPVLGSTADLVEIAAETGVELTVLTGGVAPSSQHMKELVWSLEQHKTNVVIAPALADISEERLQVRPVGGVPLIHVDHPRWERAIRWRKRAFDVAGSASLIALLSPVFLFAALRIKLHDGGPVLYRHSRIGRDGQPFDCLKFRTMVVDADAKVDALRQQVGQNALLFKVKDDPRITKPGKWLRRYSIDELPQFFNVLRGDMSLVGPRPQVQREVDEYQGGMSRRLLVRPGITGLWQVSGRSNLSAEEAMRLDLYYVDNWSMLQDVSILARTVRAVVGSDGAY
ncbi:sugar transferase [Nocardioides sp. J9]|uniref:sugar transferase n=1 Tax=Nocardioides sp. J9 TaxID=935844 RepID=UPI0016473E2E|nr:sugar transferase [Nocardioides sp. J9]